MPHGQAEADVQPAIRHHRRHARRPGRDPKGLRAGDDVVAAGQIKLRNNIAVLVNNSVLPRQPGAHAARPVAAPRHEIHRHLHPPPGAGQRRQPDDPGAGLRAFSTLPVLEYPKTENAVITVTTTYYGADADDDGRLRHHAAGERDRPGQRHRLHDLGEPDRHSTITLNLRLNYDANRAMTEVNAKINSVLNQLPSGVQQPVMTVKVGQSLDALIIGFSSDVLAPNQITDYLTRNVQPALQAVTACRRAELLGGQNFALRAWLDPQKLAPYGVTAADVSARSPPTTISPASAPPRARWCRSTSPPRPTCTRLEQFRNLVIKQVNGGIIRLGDVAHVVLGADNYDSRRVVRRQEGRLYRHPDRALGQPAERHQRREGRCCRASRRSCRPG